MIAPYAAIEFAALRTDGYQEQSSVPASANSIGMAGRTTVSIPAYFGARFSNTVRLENGFTLTPRGTVALVHEFQPAQNLTAWQVATPGSEFQIAGPRSSRNTLRAQVGARLSMSKQLSLSTDFIGEFSRSARGLGVNVGMHFLW